MTAGDWGWIATLIAVCILIAWQLHVNEKDEQHL